MRDEEGYTYREIRRGSFSRTVTLPGGLKTEDATADFENGLLTLRIPKAEEAKPRQIRISANAEPRRLGAPGDAGGSADGDQEQGA